MASRQLLENLVEESKLNITDITKNQQLQLMRSLKDDDAKCLICNSGDYEEED